MREPAVRLRLAQTFVGGLALFILAVGSLPPHSYIRDLRQDYLTARALREGLDFFTPVPDLSALYFPYRIPNGAENLHPPALILLSVPTSFLPFELVFPLGLALNTGLLIWVGRWLGLSFPGSLALAAWPPIWWVLYQDQYELLLLVLVMLAWRASSLGQFWRAGIWLGVATAIKLYPALFLVPFAARRQFPVLLGAAGAFALAQLPALVAIGPAGLAHYYLAVLPGGAMRDARLALNTSPNGSLLRLFGGATDVEPLIPAPDLVVPLAAAFSLFALVALVRLPPPAAPPATQLALPAAWGYQVVLALPQMVTLLRDPDRRWLALLASAAASFVQPPLVFYANELIVTLTGWTGQRAPPVSGVVGAIQTIGCLGLLLLCFRAAHRGPSASPRPHE